MEVYFVIGLIAGAVSAAIASSKGRNPVGWFFFGFLFGLIAVIVAAVVGNLKEQERHRAHSMAERRRLREQLRQEKMKGEAFRRHAAGRLDSHDEALGLDTRGGPALAGGAARQPLQPGTAQPPPVSQGDRQWHYHRGDESVGPVSQSTLHRLLTSGELDPSVLVWTEGQDEWLPASRFRVFTDAGPS